MANRVYECIVDEAIGFKEKKFNSVALFVFKKGARIEVDETDDSWMRACKREGKPWVYYYTKAGAKKPAWKKVRDAQGNWLDGSAGSTVGGAVINQEILSNVDSFKKVATPPQWIVIHNTAGSSTVGELKRYFENGAGGRKNVATQYGVDDKAALQMLPDECRPNHAGGPKKGQYGADRGASNSNSIGIEICDGASCNIDSAIDNGIEVCRYLMQKYNIPIDNVIKHQDVSGKDCPWYMIDGGKFNGKKGDGTRWTRFKNECVSRNQQGLPFRFGGGSPTAGMGTGGGVLPNFDNRENWEWTEKWDGVTFSFIPPRNSCSVKDQEDYFELNKYEQKYNYVCDAETFEEQTNPNYICFSMEDNDRNTYIQNALWGSNKAIKNTVSVGVFIDPKSEKFEDMQIKLIQNIGQIMYKLDLDTNDLWREFDLNRAASPFMYLDRKTWKLFLDEIHKQLEWRREKYGEHPEIIPTPVGPPPKPQNQGSIGMPGAPGYIASGTNIAAEFTAYCPFDGKDALSGGLNDCMGNRLNVGDKVLATPHGKALYGTRAMVYGTGVPELDGQVFTIRDTGSAIKPKGDGTWVVDILGDTTEWCNNVVGRKKNACLRIEKVPLDYAHKPAHKDPEQDGLNQPQTGGGTVVPVLKDKKPDEKPTDPENPDTEVDEETGTENTDRDITSPEHYFEIEEIEDDCPKPAVIITQKEFNDLMEKYSDSRMIDIYAMKHEPWDKDLEHIREAEIKEDDRLAAMTKKIETNNENTFHYNVIESSPGGSAAGDHSVSVSAELNILAKPDPVNVDPIYPDLTIIPNYSTADYNQYSQNRVPLYMMDEASVGDDAATEGQFAYDYSLLKDKEKKSAGRPVNYFDPYVYDDRVHDLELHHPKVKIDEIELKLYDCNHPGCPVSQPMAKSISAMAEAHITQSKKIEQRLVRIENTLAWLVRNFGRLGARLNVNCTYWGGFDHFNKYKTIRCLKDDRVEEGCSVTIDQCLSCTRFEPIIGQIYDILDENGMNGSAILDDMQMSYMDLNTMESLNSIHKRNVSPKYANVKTDGEGKFESLITKWHDLDLEIYKKKLEQLKEERSKELEELNKKYEEEKAKLEKEEQEKADLLETNKNESVQTTKASRTKPEDENKEEDNSSDDNLKEEGDEVKEDKDKEIFTQLINKHQKPNMSLIWDKDLDEIKEEDYLFKMDWTPMDLNLQEPDVKPYPNEHIKSKYKIQGGDAGDEETGNIKIDPEDSKDKVDKKYTRDKTENDSENNNSEEGTTEPEDHKPWDPGMDFESDLKYDKETNEKLQAGEWVDTREVADTTELNKYTSEDFYYEGFNINRGGGSIGGMGSGAQCRAKIVEMALKIVEDHKNSKACYSMARRTTDYNKPVLASGNGLSNVPGYDCSSFVSCCYRHAGLTDACDKNSTALASLCESSYKERCTPDSISTLIQGDIIFRPKQAGLPNHVMIYIGNDQVAHSSSSSPPVPKGIKIDTLSTKASKYTLYTLRPPSLIAADKVSGSSGGGRNGGEACQSTTTKNGQTLACVWSFKGAVCSHYDTGSKCADGTRVGPNVVAAHNIPYGTKIYIPDMDGHGGGGKAGNMDLGPKNNGVYRVADTGHPYFDFDVYGAGKVIGKECHDVYVLSWGTNTNMWSFTDATRDAKKKGNFEQAAWKKYLNLGPKTLGFLKFNQEDANFNTANPLGSV